MRIKLLCISKTSFDFIEQGNNLYINRLIKLNQFEMLCIPDLKNTKNMPTEELKRKEADLLMKQITPTDKVILLDEAGRTFTSAQFAKFIDKQSIESVKQVVFVIGGAYGFDDSMYKRADYKISLSKMTFSHQIIRLIFLEQLYRAFTIIKGLPYHNQ